MAKQVSKNSRPPDPVSPTRECDHAACANDELVEDGAEAVISLLTMLLQFLIRGSANGESTVHPT